MVGQQNCIFDRLQCGPLSTSEVVPLGHEVAQALSAAQGVEVIHRDLKPHTVPVAGFDCGQFRSSASLPSDASQYNAQAQAPPARLPLPLGCLV